MDANDVSILVMIIVFTVGFPLACVLSIDSKHQRGQIDALNGKIVYQQKNVVEYERVDK